MSKPVISGFLQGGRPFYVLEAFFVLSSSRACCYCFVFLVSPCFLLPGHCQADHCSPASRRDPKSNQEENKKTKNPSLHVVTYIPHNKFWTQFCPLLDMLLCEIRRVLRDEYQTRFPVIRCHVFRYQYFRGIWCFHLQCWYSFTTVVMYWNWKLYSWLKFDPKSVGPHSLCSRTQTEIKIEFTFREIWGSHGCDNEESTELRHRLIWYMLKDVSCECPAFVSRLKYLEERGNNFLWNLYKNLPHYTVSRHRKE